MSILCLLRLLYYHCCHKWYSPVCMPNADTLFTSLRPSFSLVGSLAVASSPERCAARCLEILLLVVGWLAFALACSWGAWSECLGPPRSLAWFAVEKLCRRWCFTLGGMTISGPFLGDLVLHAISCRCLIVLHADFSSIWQANNAYFTLAPSIY